MKTENTEIPKGPFKFLIFTSRPYREVAFLAIFFVIAASIAGNLVPYVFKRIVDSVNNVPGFGPEAVWFWAMTYVLISFGRSLLFRCSGFSGMRLATGVRTTSRKVLTEHVTQHGHNFFSNRFAGAIANKVKNAADGVSSLVTGFLWGWLTLFVDIVMSIGFVFYTNLYVGGIFLVWILVIAPVNIFFVRKRAPLALASQRLETKLQGDTIDTLTNVSAMHDYARRSFELERITRLVDIARLARLKNWSYSEWVLVLNNVLEAIFTGGMMFATIYAWHIGIVTAGDIILIFTLVVSIRSSLTHVGGSFNDYGETISQVKEGLAEVLEDHELKDVPGAKRLEVSEGEIMLRDISFKYETHDIFTGLNVAVKPGQRVGLIGRSGAGKSTLMKLLTRQYNLMGGNIFIDGQDISKVTQESLREAIGVVPQEPLLFHRSLKENIKYGNLSATNGEMVAAAEQAQAHQFIDALPKKYDTLVGERGVKLSGGERQRVAIARAFLKDAKILLLDEATSALDSESEKMIQEALEKLMEGKTVIAIAHRLSTLARHGSHYCYGCRTSGRRWFS
jgi:ATP-binding cassette subfamily B protein